MEIQKPNLFSFATSELSQDAFICWLASWAKPELEEIDNLLHKTAKEFITSLIRKCKDVVPVIQTINVQRQDDRIDILIKVNEGKEDQLAILIEDKMHTSNHSDQLERYYKLVNEKFLAEQIIPLYFKTGYQSRFDIGEKYKTYLRKDFLGILRDGGNSGIKNAIFSDFLHYLEAMESAVLQYSIKEKWENGDWMGFFLALYENREKLQKNEEANWNYIANPSGGFYGFWWHFLDISSRCRVYIQLENVQLCFKIKAKEKEYYSIDRQKVFEKLLNSATELKLPVERPARMGSGKYMTVLRLSGDYRIFKNGYFEMDKTIENLQASEKVINLAFNNSVV